MKLLSYRVLLFTFLTFLLFGCENDDITHSNIKSNNIDLNSIKKAYKDQFKLELFKNLKNEPLWEEATVANYNGEVYLEIPFRIINDKDLPGSTSVSIDKLIASNNELKIAHFYALDISNNTDSFNELSLDNLQSFNGFLTIFNLDKEVIDLKRYNNGKESFKKYTLTESYGNVKHMNEDEENCENVTENIYTRICSYWMDQDGNPIELIMCTPWEVSESYTYLSCEGENSNTSTESNITEEEVVQILDSLTGKAKCIYDKLKNSSTDFADHIKKFDPEFPVSHLKFKINNSLPTGNYGRTFPPENFVITIEMSNTQLANISDVGSAVALAHEVVHAEIFRKMLAAAKKGDLNAGLYTTQERINYVNNLMNNFDGLYDYYIERYKPTWNHNMMAAHYRNTIADMAQDFDNNAHSRQDYEDMAWVGLRVLEDGALSIAYDGLTLTEKTRIQAAISSIFHNGLSNCE